MFFSPEPIRTVETSICFGIGTAASSSISEWDLKIYLRGPLTQSIGVSSSRPFFDIDQDAKLLFMCLIKKIAISCVSDSHEYNKKLQLQRSVFISQRKPTLQWQRTSLNWKTRLGLRWARLLKSFRKIWTDGGSSGKL